MTTLVRRVWAMKQARGSLATVKGRFRPVRGEINGGALGTDQSPDGSMRDAALP